MLNFILCDDNSHLLAKLEKILSDIFSNNNLNAKVSFSSNDPDKILNYTNNNSVDVVLLDINLKHSKNGLDLAKEIRKKNKNIYLIFITGHLEYALVAYKYKTFDYIAKPIIYERLEESILRIFNDITNEEKFYIKIDNKNTLIDESEIFYIKRDGMKLVFHTLSKNYESYNSFNKILENLPKNYVRCHKSFIVNINKIKYLEPVKGTISFSDGHICEIGPKFKSSFMEVIQKHGNF